VPVAALLHFSDGSDNIIEDPGGSALPPQIRYTACDKILDARLSNPSLKADVRMAFSSEP